MSNFSRKMSLFENYVCVMPVDETHPQNFHIPFPRMTSYDLRTKLGYYLQTELPCVRSHARDDIVSTCMQCAGPHHVFFFSSSSL